MPRGRFTLTVKELLKADADVNNRMGTGDTPALAGDFMRDYNDALMVSYLATVTKNANAVNDLSEKFMLVNARGSKLV